jgi:tripartite-type tricarboxylate transporter receptor subunit TctC
MAGLPIKTMRFNDLSNLSSMVCFAVHNNLLGEIKMFHIRTCFLSLAALAVALMGFLSLSTATAQYYKGKTITVVVGLGPSSGGTTLARLISKHMSMQIAGKPKIVIKNMPGGALLKAHNFVHAKAPKDGTVLYYGPRQPLGELIGMPGMNFKYKEFTVLGGVQVADLVNYVRTDSLKGGLKSGAQLVKAPEVIIGGINVRAIRVLASILQLDMLGVNFRFIPGYRGSGKLRAAVLNGEVQMGTDAAHAYLNRVVPTMVKKGIVIPVWQIPSMDANGKLVKSPLLPNLKSFSEVYRQVKGTAPSGIKWDAIKNLIKFGQTVQHMYFGPPGMNKDAAAAFRKAFIPAMTSTAYKADALKTTKYVPTGIHHKRASEVLSANKATPPEVVKFFKSYIAKHAKKRKKKK